MNEKITAIIVTYNRKNYLSALLDTIKQQTRKVDRILIIDNFSTDHTAEHLMDLGIIASFEIGEITCHIWDGTEILYYRNADNTGGAGGFHKGFQIALTMNNDYVWLMDDDVLPQNDCLEKLLAKNNSEYGVCIPNRSTGTFQDRPVLSFNWDNPDFLTAGKIFQDHYGPDDCVEVCDMPFEGPLIRMDIVKKAGLSEESYFIFYDDSDYALRCLQHTKILFVAEAHLTKRILPNEYTAHFSWRDYYMYRNDFLFDRHYNPNKSMPYRRAFHQIIRGIRRQLKARNLKACRYILKAYWDALLNKRGKTVNPGNL